MKKTKLLTLITTIVALIVSLILIKSELLTNNSLRIIYPLNNALFPKDFAAPTFMWTDKSTQVNSWKIVFNVKGHNAFFVKVTDRTSLRPSEAEWDSIKKVSKNQDIDVVVQRNSSKTNAYFSVQGKLAIRISNDPVEALIMYRQIPLPFGYAEEHINETSYSTYNVSSYETPRHEALEKFPVCGNCHSSSADGKTIALDFDAVTRDKGGYFVAKVDTQIVFDKNNYMSWSKLLGKSTFGLFSKISPSGRYIVTTVKDRAISKKFDEISRMPYSQLFVPVNGVLAIYDTQTKKFWELPGANDMKLVQTNAIWTPDEKNIIFARSKALPYPDKNSVYKSFMEEEKTVERFVKEEIDMKFDLYTIPFNEGKGGVAKPIEGASNNGKSNFFPAISRDGKWLVYCQANNYMMLRPESRLYILSANGGKPRKMESNLPQMNSWHSWSPNGKWIVFVSKAFSIYSDLFLTHVNEDGSSSVPVLLQNSKRPDCATNYPEFMNVNENMTINMKYKYINLNDIKAAFFYGKVDSAKLLLKQFLDQGQVGTPWEYRELSDFMIKLNRLDEAKKYSDMADKLELTYNRGF